MYTVGRYISQGVYTVAGPFHPFGGAVDIIVVQQEDGTFKSSPWYVKFGKFQGVLKQKENVVDVAVNGNDVDFHMFLDATGEAYFLKDADLDSEGSIFSPRSAVSSGDDTVVNTLAIRSVKQDDGVQANTLELQESQVQAFQVETISDGVLTSLCQNGVVSDRGFTEEDENPDEHTIAKSNRGQVSDELLSTARGSMEQENTVESGAAICALFNHAIGLDPCYNSGPANSLVANAALVALEKVASSVQPPSTLECLPEKGILKAPCIENGVSLFSKGTSPLSNSNQSLPMVHFTQEATGSALQGSNSLDSQLVEALPNLEFLRKGSGYSLNRPPGIMIASADGQVFLEENYPEELGVVASEVAHQRDQWASETNLMGFCPQQNEIFESLEILDTRLHGPMDLAEADHDVSEEDVEKDWSGARTTTEPAEVVKHGSKTGCEEPLGYEKEKHERDSVQDDGLMSLSGKNDEMMQGAREVLPQFKVLSLVADQKALQVEVTGSEVEHSGPSNGLGGDPIPGLQDGTFDEMQMTTEIQPDGADGSVVMMPSENNSVSSVDEGNPSPVLTTAIGQEIAWRDATFKAAAALRASPLCAKAGQPKQVLDRKTKPGGTFRSSPKRIGDKQSLPTNSTPAALDKNMQLAKTPQKKADGTEQSERRSWVWWGWRGSPALPKQSSDPDEKKDSKGVNGTTTQADEVNTQTSSKPQEVGFQSSGSVDGQNSGILEANKMLTIENDAQKSKDEESELNSIDQSLMVAERTKGNLSEQNTENGGSEDEKKEEDKKEEENRDGLAIEVVSSIAIQNTPGEAENLGRRSSLGIMFQGHGREQVLAESAKSSLERAETISDLLENSWKCGSGLKNGESQPTIESQTPIGSSSLYSQHEAAVQDSHSRSSHSQRSEKVETMRREEELAVNEGNIMPANKDSTLSSSVCLQGGETSSTEAADDFGIPRHSEANCSDADCATGAHYPSTKVIDIAAGEKRPGILTGGDTSLDSGLTGLQGETRNANSSDNGIMVSTSNMDWRENLAGFSLAVISTSANLTEEVGRASSLGRRVSPPGRLGDEDVTSVPTLSQKLASPCGHTEMVSSMGPFHSMAIGGRLQEQKLAGENASLMKYPVVLSLEQLASVNGEQGSNPATEDVLVSGACSIVMAPTYPANAGSSKEGRTSAAPVVSLVEEKPSNKGDDAVDNSDLQGDVSEKSVPLFSPAQDERVVGAGSFSNKLLAGNLALLRTSSTLDGASCTQMNVVEVVQTMPVRTEVLVTIETGDVVAETREKYEVVSTQNGENRSEDDLENPLPYSGTGAVIKKVSHFESNTSQEEEEECHGKVAVGEIDYGTSISHGENGSEDELYNPLSYGDIGSASRKSIYFEANSSEEEEEEEEILGKVVDGDEDLDIFRRKSDPIGVPLTLENSALDDMFLIAKDHPLSESLPDVRFQSADATISAIQSALSRSVGSEPLPRTQRSADRKDSFLGNPVRSPAEGTHEDFKQNLVEKCVGSPPGSGRSEAESAGGDGAVPDLVETAAETGVEVSLCRHLLKEHMGSEEAAEAFASVKVSLHEFKSNAASIIANDKLVVRVGGQYYPWSVAAPVVLGILTFGQVIMPATDGAIPMECPEPVPKSQAAVGTIVPAARGGWNLWPFPLRRPKTPEQSIVPNPLVSRDTLLVASGTAVQSPFVNDLMFQNAYYERPRRNKVRTIIPTSQMLAQMNLKEGNNRITFTFFTRMLGKQQVDARVYLWKWNTRIVISDVDGTITKSDVLGQVMPLVGKDWTQSGVARLFSAIKENGYELLFLSARAISQADLTRQFLFNVKQDGETLPDGPVVISPDGLFPSLYREVIRRTPHEFKIGCLQDIRSLFPEGCNPFYAGFGNRDTDEISYLKVGIPKGKIFIINPKGEVAVNNRVHVKTYTSLHKLVNDMFPAQTYMEQEDYNSWNFWKLPLPDIEDDLKSSLLRRASPPCSSTHSISNFGGSKQQDGVKALDVH